MSLPELVRDWYSLEETVSKLTIEDQEKKLRVEDIEKEYRELEKKKLKAGETRSPRRGWRPMQSVSRMSAICQCVKAERVSSA